LLSYTLRRLAALVPILIGVSLVVFILTRIMPGNIALIMLGPNAAPEQIESLEKEFDLDSLYRLETPFASTAGRRRRSGDWATPTSAATGRRRDLSTSDNRPALIRRL
jgi:ABC-type dipeptide/oligopeptide/nickel transport system permease component